MVECDEVGHQQRNNKMTGTINKLHYSKFLHNQIPAVRSPVGTTYNTPSTPLLIFFVFFIIWHMWMQMEMVTRMTMALSQSHFKHSEKVITKIAVVRKYLKLKYVNRS